MTAQRDPHRRRCRHPSTAGHRAYGAGLDSLSQLQLSVAAEAGVDPTDCDDARRQPVDDSSTVAQNSMSASHHTALTHAVAVPAIFLGRRPLTLKIDNVEDDGSRGMSRRHDCAMQRHLSFRKGQYAASGFSSRSIRGDAERAVIASAKRWRGFAPADAGGRAPQDSARQVSSE